MYYQIRSSFWSFHPFFSGISSVFSDITGYKQSSYYMRSPQPLQKIRLRNVLSWLEWEQAELTVVKLEL
jgi:hypothetical protein